MKQNSSSKKSHYPSLFKLVIFCSLMSITSCTQPNIPEMVVQLLETDKREKRLSIADELADSLSIIPIQLLANEINSSNYAEHAIGHILRRYCKLYSEADDLTQIMIREIITKAFCDESEVYNLTDNQKISYLLDAIKVCDSNYELQNHLNSCLKTFGYHGLSSLVEAWYSYQSSAELFSTLQSYGKSAIEYASNKLGEDEDAEELLAKIGSDAVPILKTKMQHSEQKVRFAAADALVKMTKYHPNAVESLNEAIDRRNLAAIALNYPYYIRKGIPNSEDILLDALRYNFTRAMCVDYLNCNNGYLEEEATKIANLRGYEVYSMPGTHRGPRWGSER
jgi:hypothetical protein